MAKACPATPVSSKIVSKFITILISSQNNFDFWKKKDYDKNGTDKNSLEVKNAKDS